MLKARPSQVLHGVVCWSVLHCCSDCSHMTQIPARLPHKLLHTWCCSRPCHKGYSASAQALTLRHIISGFAVNPASWFRCLKGHIDSHISGLNFIILVHLLFFRTPIPDVGFQTDTNLNTPFARVDCQTPLEFCAEHAPWWKINMPLCTACVGPLILAVVLDTCQVMLFKVYLNPLFFGGGDLTCTKNSM